MARVIRTAITFGIACLVTAAVSRGQTNNCFNGTGIATFECNPSEGEIACVCQP